MNTVQMSELSYPLKPHAKPAPPGLSWGLPLTGLKWGILMLLGRLHIYSAPCIIAVECLPMEGAMAGAARNAE